MGALINATVVGVIVFFAYLGLDGYLRRKKQSEDVLRRASGKDSDFEDYALHGDNPQAVSLDREKSEQAQSMERLMNSFGIDVDGALKKLKSQFMRAGIQSPDAPIYYLFFQRIASIVVVAIGLLFFTANASGLVYVLFALIGTIIIVLGLFGPYLYLKNMILKRAQVLENSFPDALDLLLVCVESGLALDAAMARVCSELGAAHPEITQELNRTRLELALMNDRVKALNNLGDRTGIVAFRSLVAALIQTERFGTSLADTLRVLSEDFRLTRLMNAETKAGKLPVKITFPLILLLLPALIIIILAPIFIKVSLKGGLFGAG